VAPQPARSVAPTECRVLSHIPEELTRRPLRRLGEGIGKVVYASEHWVIRRERSPLEMFALILLWRALRNLERLLPGAWGRRLRNRPSGQIRFLRVLVQGVILVFPRALWYSAHIRDMLRLYHRRSIRGEQLAKARLTGSELIPERIEFPPARVRIGGWPGWLMVSEAAERLDTTLYDKMIHLAREDRFGELEEWLDRLLQARQDGWRRGLFSLDAHLKNYGAIGERIVLLDTGGLTNRWSEVERRLEAEESIAQPHVQLGLGTLLADHPEIAQRFDQRWKATVNREVVRSRWPQPGS
jgi:hypothetical protein